MGNITEYHNPQTKESCSQPTKIEKDDTGFWTLFIYMNALSFIANTQYIGEYDVPFLSFSSGGFSDYFVLPSPAAWPCREDTKALSNAMISALFYVFMVRHWLIPKKTGDWNSWQCLLSNQHSPSIQNPNTKKALSLNIHKAFVWFWVRYQKVTIRNQKVGWLEIMSFSSCPRCMAWSEGCKAIVPAAEWFSAHRVWKLAHLKKQTLSFVNAQTSYCRGNTCYLHTSWSAKAALTCCSAHNWQAASTSLSVNPTVGHEVGVMSKVSIGYTSTESIPML